MHFVWNSRLPLRYQGIATVLKPAALLVRNVIAAYNEIVGRDQVQDRDVARHLTLGVAYICGCDVRGDVAEFGTMCGRTASVLVRALRRYDGRRTGKRKLHLFDSFLGLPKAESEVDASAPHVTSGLWAEGVCYSISKRDLVRICARSVPKERIVVYDGWFQDTLPTINLETKFALIHIDSDLYSSAKQVLDHCFVNSLVAEGAAIFFDNWNCNRARPALGERRAWSEAVESHSVVCSDLGAYGSAQHKFIVHSYKPQMPVGRR